MRKPLVVYGAGGHGKVVAEILLASRQQIAGFIDDNPALSGSHVLGFPVFTADGYSKMQAHKSLSGSATIHGANSWRIRSRALAES